MRFFFQNEGDSDPPLLIATPDDLRDPEFIKEIMAADIILALDLNSPAMWYLWGEEVAVLLRSGNIKEVRMAYIKIGFESDEFDYVVRSIHRIKEGVPCSQSRTPHRNWDTSPCPFNEPEMLLNRPDDALMLRRESGSMSGEAKRGGGLMMLDNVRMSVAKRRGRSLGISPVSFGLFIIDEDYISIRDWQIRCRVFEDGLCIDWVRIATAYFDLLQAESHVAPVPPGTRWEGLLF